jgi:hypothetical protein
MSQLKNLVLVDMRAKKDRGVNVRADGYRCGVIIDAEAGDITRGDLDQVEAVVSRWLEKPQLCAQWTVEAGCVDEFLKDPFIAAYIEIKAKVAVYCQRKTDAIKIEGALKRRIFRQ